jgi:peroxiredoxin Q/BCP
MKIKTLFLALGTFCFDIMQAKLKMGDEAPNFSLQDQNGVTHDLSSLRGKKVALCFYPKDNTPGCTKQVCSLRRGWTDLAKEKITVLGINFDDSKAHRDFVDTHQLPFPLMSDKNKKTARAYGATRFLLPMPKRITFLIDEKGKIAYIINNVNVEDHAQQILDTWK